MPASIVNDLLDLFADTLTCQPGSENEYGDFVASGDAIALPAYIRGRNEVVRDEAGNEATSSFAVIVGITQNQIDAWIDTGWDGWVDPDWVQGDEALPAVLSTQGYRYTIDTRFSPYNSLKAIAVKRAHDENGPHHEVVYFP